MDEILRDLERQIQAGDTQAIGQYLRVLQRLASQPLVNWRPLLHKLVRSVYCEEGVEYITVSALRDLIVLLYGTEMAETVNNYIDASEGRFYFDNEGFPEVCRLLGLEYICSGCEITILDPEGMDFCYLCDQFYCVNTLCGSSYAQCRKCSLGVGETICPSCSQTVATETLQTCFRCNQSVCGANCIATLDPITGLALMPGDPRLCETCYYQIYQQNQADLGLCEGCNHPVHTDAECSLCPCFI